MLDTRALKNSTNLSAWKAWEGEAYQRSGFNAFLGSVFALTLAFVIFPSLFPRALGDDLVRTSLIGLVLYLGTSFALMVFAVLRMNAWKRANPWTPPS
ncbi:hypothetical protein [Caulobacter sp. LARHSG274]